MKLHIVTDIKEYYITSTNTMSKVKSKEFIDSTDGSSSDSDSDAELKAKKKKEKAEKRKSEENTEKPAKKTKTEEDSSSKKSEKSPKKKEKSGASSSIEGNAHDGFSLGKMRRISILEFKGRKMVNIREYYTDAAGDEKPGKKGVALMPESWDALLQIKDEVNNASSGEKWDLGKKKWMRVNEFKGRTLYDIREMYEKDGELKPGNKGISLSREQWDTVMSHSDALSDAL